jgi:hypothetical protein
MHDTGNAYMWQWRRSGSCVIWIFEDCVLWCAWCLVKCSIILKGTRRGRLQLQHTHTRTRTLKNTHTYQDVL